MGRLGILNIYFKVIWNPVGVFVVMQGGHYGSLELSGVHWKMSGTQWGIIGAQWRSVGLSGAHCCSVELSGSHWDSLGLSGVLVRLSGTECGSLKLNGDQWGSVGLSESHWSSVGLSAQCLYTRVESGENELNVLNALISCYATLHYYIITMLNKLGIGVMNEEGIDSIT